MSNELIFIVVLGIISFFLIRVAKSLLFKLIGFLLIIPIIFIILYMTDTGPFSKNLLSRDHLMATFCDTSPTEPLCICVTKPYVSMIEGKFTQQELLDIESKNYETAYVFSKLYDSLKSAVTQCAGNEDSASVLLQTFSAKLLPTGEKTEAITSWIMEKSNHFKNSQKRLTELDEKL